MHVEVSTEADEEEDDLQSSAELQCQGVQLTRVNELHDAMLPARFNDFSRPLVRRLRHARGLRRLVLYACCSLRSWCGQSSRVS